MSLELDDFKFTISTEELEEVSDVPGQAFYHKVSMHKYLEDAEDTKILGHLYVVEIGREGDSVISLKEGLNNYSNDCWVSYQNLMKNPVFHDDIENIEEYLERAYYIEYFELVDNTADEQEVKTCLLKWFVEVLKNKCYGHQWLIFTDDKIIDVVSKVDNFSPLVIVGEDNTTYYACCPYYKKEYLKEHQIIYLPKNMDDGILSGEHYITQTDMNHIALDGGFDILTQSDNEEDE